MSSNSRIDNCFSKLKAANHPALVTFIMAGDPSIEISAEILSCLSESGSDIIEIGMPFSDPAADGSTIQLAGNRALSNKISLINILSLVREFRLINNHTPIILMGYYNPIISYGIDKFVKDSKEAGVDGFIVVDLPPEEDQILFEACTQQQISLIKLITPTTDDQRLEKILPKASGFLYYVSVTGVTGTKAPSSSEVKEAINKFRKHTTLPIVVGFGIKTVEQAMSLRTAGDGIVIGSAIVKYIEEQPNQCVPKIKTFINEISNTIKS